MTANNKQIAGTHYKKNGIQPWDYIIANNIGYLEGSAIKYITRWKDKNGIDDIRKAIHFLEKLIETEIGAPAHPGVVQRSHLSGVAYSETIDDSMGGFCDINNVAPSYWNPNLNTEAILRPDNV